ncbi:MAG: hypothetical protein GY940_24135, partial [bacterium]|nr:hypothetical protein [bacterium]
MKPSKNKNDKKKSVFHVVGVLLFLVLAGGLGVSLHASIPAIEREALIALYNATDGDNWSNNSGWKEGVLEPDGFGPVGSEGNWSGITVSDGHVTLIAITSNNLTGSIPPELGNLSNLESLFLYNNQLNGSIPPELADLSNLVELHLSGNQLSGSIPTELGNLSKLISLYLSSNRLSGNIPPELGNLSSLSFLYLNDNQLSGNIPSELGNLSNLTYLSLSGNRL